MKVLDLKKDKPTVITVASIGPSGSGKTYFAAGFPRPILLMDAPERGWTTIQNMPPEAFYETGRYPEVWQIDSMQDMAPALKEIKAMREKDPKRVLTVGIDSISFYADLFITGYKQQKPDVDNFELYGRLKDHLLWMAVEIQRLGINSVWTMLPEYDDKGQVCGISVPGGWGKTKLAALLDYRVFHRHKEAQGSQGEKFEIRTHSVSSAFTFRGRDGGKLPDPLPEPTYKAMALALGLPDPQS